MIDVVIPTLLNTKKEVFSYTLNELNNSIYVNKIIIIDNTEDNLFKHLYKDSITDKMQLIEPNGNILVNPAWNKGLEEVTSEFYLLLNDDILCSEYIISCCDYILRTTKVSLLTCSTINKLIDVDNYKKMIQKDVKPMVTSSIPNNRIGWFMCGRKNEWIPIPKELKVFYGDDFIYSNLRIHKKTINMISNLNIVHYESTTINTHINNIRPIIKNDRLIWEAVIHKNIMRGIYKF